MPGTQPNAAAEPGVWHEPRKILVLLAHPDDPEFFCGGTLARWATQGHQIEYCLITCGDKGFNDTTTPDTFSTSELCAVRHEEQQLAASVIGARAVHFLDHADGYLVADLDLRKELVIAIRRLRPDILVTCDPQTLFTAFGINHPDHRAAGQAVLDAVFPAAGNAAYFPDLLETGLAPHTPREVWCALTNQPTVVLDITEFWPTKLEALLQHRTQIGDIDAFKARMIARRVEGSTEEHPRFEERFRVVKYG